MGRMETQGARPSRMRPNFWGSSGAWKRSRSPIRSRSQNLWRRQRMTRLPWDCRMYTTLMPFSIFYISGMDRAPGSHGPAPEQCPPPPHTQPRCP